MLALESRMHGSSVPDTENTVPLEEAAMPLSPKLVSFHGPTPSNSGTSSRLWSLSRHPRALRTRLLLLPLSLQEPSPRAIIRPPRRHPITHFVEHSH